MKGEKRTLLNVTEERASRTTDEFDLLSLLGPSPCEANTTTGGSANGSADGTRRISRV